MCRWRQETNSSVFQGTPDTPVLNALAPGCSRGYGLAELIPAFSINETQARRMQASRVLGLMFAFGAGCAGTCAAAWVPARSAAKVDPAKALRCE
jgi:hypothetical protein